MAKKAKYTFKINLPSIEIQRITNLKEIGGDWGQTTEDENGNIVIKIDSKLSGVGLRRTILHEFFHATLELSGMSHLFTDEQEEALTRMHENIYIPLWPDMEELIKDMES